MDAKIALITGANRGLGRGLAEALGGDGWKVLMVCRDEDAGRAAEDSMRSRGMDVSLFLADMARIADIDRLYDEVAEEVDCIDVLVNNAAVNLDVWDDRLEDISLSALQTTLDINLRGPIWMCAKFVPMVRQSQSGRIINYTSGLGRLTPGHPGSYPLYSMSKVAMNGLTAVLAGQLKEDGIIVASVDPGWVKTDMGGPGAQLPLEEGIESAYLVATTGAGELENGVLYHRGQVLTW